MPVHNQLRYPASDGATPRPKTSASSHSFTVPLVRKLADNRPVYGPGVPVPDGATVTVEPIGSNFADSVWFSTSGDLDPLNISSPLTGSPVGGATQVKKSSLPREIRVSNLSEVCMYAVNGGDGILITVQTK